MCIVGTSEFNADGERGEVRINLREYIDKGRRDGMG
jgi:hypothetical protein